jgi:hypothetical protein
MSLASVRGVGVRELSSPRLSLICGSSREVKSSSVAMIFNVVEVLDLEAYILFILKIGIVGVRTLLRTAWLPRLQTRGKRIFVIYYIL